MVHRWRQHPELQNAIERALILADGGSSLRPPRARCPAAPGRRHRIRTSDSGEPATVVLPLAEVERQSVSRAPASEGQQVAGRGALGLSAALSTRLRRFGLSN